MQAKINELHWKQSTEQMSFDTPRIQVHGPTLSEYATNYGQNWRSNDKPINEVESINYVEQASTLIETVFHSIQMQEKVDPNIQDKINKRLSKQLSKLLV